MNQTLLIDENLTDSLNLVVNSNEPIKGIQVTMRAREDVTVIFSRDERLVTLETAQDKITAPIKSGSYNVCSLWFICDSSRFLFACGTGTKPQLGESLELLLSDIHSTGVTEVDLTSTIPSLSLRQQQAPLLHLSMKKWNTDRSLRTFKGNTIVCNVKKDSEEFNAFALAQDKFRELSVGYSQAFLPPESFHMTVLSLVNEGNIGTIMKRKPQGEVKWDSLHRSYKRKLSCVLERYKNTTIDMKVIKFEARRHFGAIVEPANARAAQLLDKMYNDFSAASGLRAPSRRYPYHVSLAYGFLPVMPHLKGVKEAFIEELENELLPLHFAVEPPFFAVFDDMGAFLSF